LERHPDNRLDLNELQQSGTYCAAHFCGFGAGAQFRHESDYVTDYGLQSNALAVPFYLQAINGERNVGAAYYQANIPLISSLTFSQSSRYDHYSDFGSAFSPRYALRFRPVEELTTYASYSRGFRAPTLAETSQKNSSGVQTASDPYSPTEPNIQENYPVLVGGNPDLKAEKTRNYNVGFEWEPQNRTAIGLDWYKIVISDAIGTGNIQTIINQNDPTVVVRNPNGTIAYVNFDYQNLNALTTQGFELNYRTAAGGRPCERELLSANAQDPWVRSAVARAVRALHGKAVARRPRGLTLHRTARQRRPQQSVSRDPRAGDGRDARECPRRCSPRAPQWLASWRCPRLGGPYCFAVR
jgi:outer membrane receptor protein involved in Fe transport